MKVLNSRLSSAGELRIWERPVPGALYVIGCDPSLGRTSAEHGDHSALFVAKRETGQRITQVAEWYGRIHAGDVGLVLAALGMEYNWALLNVERNISDAPRWVLQSVGYPTERFYVPPRHRELRQPIEQQYFFNKHGSNQRFLLDTLDSYLSNDAILIKSPELIAELRGLQKGDDGNVDTRGRDRSVACMMAVIADATWPYEHVEPEKTDDSEKPCPVGIDPVFWKIKHGHSSEAGSLYTSPSFVASRRG